MYKRKATTLLYFFLFLLIFISCKKKEKPLSERLIGSWYVERVTTYDEDYAIPDKVLKNYRDVGKFTFRGDGTGVYTFIDSVDFQYTVSEDNCHFEFDASDINDQSSPILYYYLPAYGMEISTYRVFSGNEETANFYHDIAGYSSTDVFNKIEFLVTKIK